MARLVKPLTATQVNNAKPKATMYKMFDGGGLFLQVNPSGGKHWKMKYRKNDSKEGLLTFGPYPAVSLEQARKRPAQLPERAAGTAYLCQRHSQTWRNYGVCHLLSGRGRKRAGYRTVPGGFSADV